MFGSAATYCSTCGMKVQKEDGIRKFDKDFCSEEHAQQYGREMKRARQLRLSRQLSQRDSGRMKGQKGSHKCC